MNFEIERIIKSITNEDLINHFVGVFFSEKMNKFIDFHGIMEERFAKYPFLILNTDRAGTTGRYWSGILDIHPKTLIYIFILLELVVLKTS